MEKRLVLLELRPTKLIWNGAYPHQIEDAKNHTQPQNGAELLITLIRCLERLAADGSRCILYSRNLASF